MKKWFLLLMSVLCMTSMPMISYAEEYAASQEEIEAVKNGDQAPYTWENDGVSWKLLYLDSNSASWKYATSQWVQVEEKYYYFNAESRMEEGWFQDPNKGDTWFFAVCDTKDRTEGDAGRVLTGWAAIPDGKGIDHYFYFGADENGRPSGMYQGEGEIYKNYTIGSEVYSFDANGHCSSQTLNFSVPHYNRSRV